MTLRAFLAAHPPIDTWSSVAALVDKESTDDGWHKTLFSETEQRERLEINVSAPAQILGSRKENKSTIFFNIRSFI